LVLAASLLATVVLGVAAGNAAADVTPSTMADIYAALQIENLAPLTGSSVFVSGDQVYFTYNLTNTSASALVVPLNTDFGAPFHLVGDEQTWVERLGPDPTIPSLAYASRDGNRYATGGEILVEDGAFPNDTIPAGGSLSRYTVLYTTGFPQGRYRYYVEYKRLFSDGDGVVQTATVDITNSSDTTPPTISVPDSISTAATSPTGASVTYSVTATDPDDAVASLNCAPASGSTFPTGTTTVNCSATDTNGNTSSASFTVHVKGASEQLADLLTDVTGVGPGTSLADKVKQAQSYLAANEVRDACSTLSALNNEVQAQSGITIPAAQAETLTATVNRITTVLGC
jgi:hypothetical protein